MAVTFALVGKMAASVGGTLVSVDGTGFAVGLCWVATAVGTGVVFALHAVVPKSTVSKMNRVKALDFTVFSFFEQIAVAISLGRRPPGGIVVVSTVIRQTDDVASIRVHHIELEIACAV